MSAFDVFSEPGDPTQFPVGTRVVLPPTSDFHFFRGTGTVVSHRERHHLGVVVLLDRPFMCQHGTAKPHEMREVGFDACDLVRA